MKISPELFKQYCQNPLGMDETIRSKYSIPDDKYYSVSVFPEKLAGNIYITRGMNRIVKAKKISKSNQKT